MLKRWPEISNTEIVLFYIGWCIVVYILFKPKNKS
jgi:hypothetical protein